MKLLFFLLFFPSMVFAYALVPKAPVNWVEMNSISPVILTWVWADPLKKIEDVPSLMIQNFPKNSKFVKFINKDANAKSCRQINSTSEKEWHQLWCIKKDSVLVLLWKGEKEITREPFATLSNWVHAYE